MHLDSRLIHRTAGVHACGSSISMWQSSWFSQQKISEISKIYKLSECILRSPLYKGVERRDTTLMRSPRCLWSSVFSFPTSAARKIKITRDGVAIAWPKKIIVLCYRVAGGVASQSHPKFASQQTLPPVPHTRVCGGGRDTRLRPTAPTSIFAPGLAQLCFRTYRNTTLTCP